MKKQFDRQTKDGDSEEKWKHFNEMSEYIYKLAGETITCRLSKNLNH